MSSSRPDLRQGIEDALGGNIMDRNFDLGGDGIGRRTAIKTLGIGVVGAASGVGLLSGSAAAQVSSDFTVADPERVVNDDGRITRYVVSVSGSFSYENFDHPAREAHIELDGSLDGGDSYHRITSSEVDGLNNTSGSRSFSLEPTDVTETPFSDEDFSVSEDGGNRLTNMKLRLSVEVSDVTDHAVSASRAKNMGLAVKNRRSDVGVDATAEGSAGGYDSHYSSLKTDEVPAGAIDLFVDYRYEAGSLSKVVYDMTVDAPYSDDEEPNNIALGFGPAGDDFWNLQVIWNPNDGPTESDFFVKTAERDGPQETKALPSNIAASKDGENVRIEIEPAGEFDYDAGDSYRFGAHVISNDGSATISTEAGKIWSSDLSWTAAPYFLTESVPEAGE
jgi:hypothetical protein